MSNYVKWAVFLPIFVLLFASITVVAVSDCNGDVPEEKTLDEVMASANKYWVNVTKESDEYYISNGSGTQACTLLCGSEIVNITGKNFFIPSGSGIRMENTMVNIKNVVDMTIEGNFVRAMSTIIVGDNDADNNNLGADVSIIAGSFITNSCITVKGGNLSEDVMFKDEASSILVKSGGRISYLYIPDVDTPGSTLLKIKNMTTGTNDDDYFKVSMVNDCKTVALEGLFVGAGSGAGLIFGDWEPETDFASATNASNSTHDTAVFNNVDLHKLDVDLRGLQGKIKIIESDNVFYTLENNVSFLLTLDNYTSVLDEMIYSGNGSLTAAMFITMNDGYTIPQTDLYCASYNDKGLVDYYIYIYLNYGEGIDSIHTGTEYEEYPVLFLVAGETYDLTQIDVKCKSGYSFDGWYYIDSFGKEVKINQPESFTPYLNMQIYAKTTPVQQDYGGFFIAIIALLAIAIVGGFAYMILKDYGILKFKKE